MQPQKLIQNFINFKVNSFFYSQYDEICSFFIDQHFIYYLLQNLEMNQVKIINSSLLNLLVNDSKDQTRNAESAKKRKMSPQQTLKSWIKKGLTQFINPVARPKTSQINFGPLETMKTSKSRRFHDKQNSIFRGKKIQSYDRQSLETRHPFRRLKTQQSDSNQEQMQWIKPQFNEFMKLSDNTMKIINRQNFRRNFKLHKYRKNKYEDIWKKHIIPQKNQNKC